MAIYYLGNTPLPHLQKPVLTIGTFDGVHLGHHAILEEVNAHAAAIGGESMVITFEPHPRQVLQPDVLIPLLTPLEEKLVLIAHAGIRHIAVAPFTPAFAQLSAAAYVADFLVAGFHPAAVVIGYDHHFGHDRRGDIALLQEWGAQLGFAVHQIPAHMVRNAAISSTQIRTALAAGDMHAAAQMLGRPYAVSGTVVPGRQLGRTIGFPTANVQPLSSAQLIPAHGVYAVRLTIDQRDYNAALSIGTRPTVSSDGSVSIEAYIFDFNQNIYGEVVTVQFIHRLRDELKFESLEALKEALWKDEADARDILAARFEEGAS